MNIFLLSSNVQTNVESLCDQHIVKMTLETAQILSTAATLLSLTNFTSRYKPTHTHHPSVQWAATSLNNFAWLQQYGETISQEYSYRYNKIHACDKIIQDAKSAINKHTIPPDLFSLAIKPEYRTSNYKPLLPLVDAVSEYINYYVKDKWHFAKWNNGRLAPTWFAPNHIKI